MKRSITRWTTALATAALLGLPVAAAANTQQPSTPPQQQQPAPQPTDPQRPQPAPQPTEPQPTQPQPTQPQPTQPQPTQPPAQPQPTQPQPTEPQPTAPPTTTQQPTTSSPSASAATGQSVSPEEHLRQARAALSDIKTTSIPARERAQFAELRRHLNALDNPAASARSPRSTARRGSTTSASGDANWGTEVAAIDRIITNLAGSDTAAGTSGTGATSTTGTAGASRSHAAAATAVDDATRAKLMDIRTHITAYAAAKSGASSSSPRTDASSTMAKDTMTSTAQSGSATAGETPRTGNYATAGNAAGQQPPTSSPDSPAGQQPSAAAQGTSPAAGQTSAAGAAAVDAEAAHRSLLAARDALNQLTQLPAAAQLSGESRTQVQQLISNFNELITNSTDWRASYTKVAGTLTALLGPDNSDAEATGGAPTTATGAAPTTGAVGTGGAATVQLDPAIRAKLVEMRNNLNEFQKASGGIAK